MYRDEGSVAADLEKRSVIFHASEMGSVVFPEEKPEGEEVKANLEKAEAEGEEAKAADAAAATEEAPAAAAPAEGEAEAAPAEEPEEFGPEAMEAFAQKHSMSLAQMKAKCGDL